MVINMTYPVNKKIIKKINLSNYDPAVKEFLLRIISLELDNINNPLWRYSDKYDYEIKHYSEKFKDEEESKMEGDM